MKRIAQDIKSGQFSHLYLLYGEEAYLRRQYCDKLRAALVPAEDTMNCSVYSGKDINVGEVVDLAGTMPFFAERRVIIIENSGWLKSGNDQLLALVKAIPDTTYLILVEEETDKRSKLYKAVTANGYAALCEMQDEATLRKWVMGLLKKENKQITPDALNLLLDKTGTNMENIRREVEKLVCYKYYDEGITALDVEELCIVQIQNQIFDMVEAVAQKKQKQALNLYYNLLALKEAPMKILALISRQFNMLLQVKEMKSKGYHESDIAKQTGLNPYYLKKKYIPQAAQFKQPQLENALKACVEAEEAVKTGRMPDMLSVELIIVSLSAEQMKNSSCSE
ncbi:MAG: DNA polymerase III subunit delta [Lachnospiraceae bacterium]|nr:DNA polymerase III subunit delta [Lachnospiraceae bacterium]MDE7183587.1 DNA polymerase III subunit delta [Lachnospiraceae bacterium]